MESKCQISSVLSDALVLKLVDCNREDLEQLKRDKDYRLRLVLWREKKTKTQNDYCWELMTKIAAAIGSSKDEVYAEMLRKYGLVDTDREAITVPADADLSIYAEHDIHFLCIKSGWQNGILWSAYKRIRGISEYDSKEMSRFIDMVVLEAKELGVETLPPHELERMRLDEINTSKE